MAYSVSHFFTPGVAATVAMHAAFGWMLLHLDGAPSAAAAVPVMVSLIDSAGETRVSAPSKPRLPSPPEPQLPRVKQIPKPQDSDVTVAQSTPGFPEPSDSPEALASVSSAEPVADETPAPASSITLPRFNADYLNNPPPVYPVLARRLGEQGRVMLRVLVRADGAPAEIAINRSSGSSRLDRAALEAVRRWRFIPARRGDTPVAAPVLVPISFTLEG